MTSSPALQADSGHHSSSDAPLSGAAARLLALFNGSDSVIGTYTPDGDARTLHRRATVADVELHLTGQSVLGLSPLRSDGTCNYGVLDVDPSDELYYASFDALLENHVGEITILPW